MQKIIAVLNFLQTKRNRNYRHQIRCLQVACTSFLLSIFFFPSSQVEALLNAIKKTATKKEEGEWFQQ